MNAIYLILGMMFAIITGNMLFLYIGLAMAIAFGEY